MTADQFWRDQYARHLAHVSGQPVDDWIRLLEAYRTARLDPAHLIDDIYRAPFDPAEYAEMVESTFAHAHGRLADELAELRRRIYATLPRRLRRLAEGHHH